MTPVQKSGIDWPAMVRDIGAEFAAGVGAAGHPHPQRHGDHGGEQDRGDGEGDGVRQPVEHHVQRGGVEGVARAEVAGEQVSQEDQYWVEQRLVEPELLADLASSSVVALGPA